MPSSQTCPGCGSAFPKNVLEERLYICETCHRHLAMPARARIESLADAGSFREFDRTLVSQDPLKFDTYRKRLKQARRGTGAGEAVTTGFCRIDGHAAVLLVFNFEFMGGTMGSVVGEKIAHAFEEAIRRKLPVVSVTATGGARVQEGMLSLMQMAKVAGAAERHGKEALAFISILTDPTFGGVTASFASLGDVILAEPGAQIGFVGPRVIAQTTGVTPPKDSHHAETLLQAGLIDLVVPRTELRGVVAYLVGHLRRQETTGTYGKQGKNGNAERRAARDSSKRSKPGDSKPLPAWENVGIARHTGRPTARLFIARMCTQFLELHGDRWGGDDHAIVGGPAELDGQTVFMIAQDRGATPAEALVSHGGMAFSYGYRKAARLMQLAAKFAIPVVTLVDTPSAQASFESEHTGIAYALANSLARMSSLPTPIVAVIIGEGGSGGAVALAVADRVLMLEHAIYSVISPEGAASILYRDVERAATVAESLKLTAHDLLRLGIIDAVVPEPAGGAHSDAEATAATLKVFVCDALHDLRAISPQRLVAMRYEKYRHIGRVGVSWRGMARRAIGRAARFVVRMAPKQRQPPAGARIR